MRQERQILRQGWAQMAVTCRDAQLRKLQVIMRLHLIHHSAVARQFQRGNQMRHLIHCAIEPQQVAAKQSVADRRILHRCQRRGFKHHIARSGIADHSGDCALRFAEPKRHGFAMPRTSMSCLGPSQPLIAQIS